MADELRERIARVIDPYAWQTGDQIDWTSALPSARNLQASVRSWKLASFAKANAILALLPQPSPGEYEGLIEEARRWAEHDGLGAIVKRLISRLADALSSALRERDGLQADHNETFAGKVVMSGEALTELQRTAQIGLDFASEVTRLRAEVESLTRERDMIAAVNADWSAYDKGVREAGKALLERYVALVNSGDCGNWDPEAEPEVIALRSALSLVPESKDNGS